MPSGFVVLSCTSETCTKTGRVVSGVASYTIVIVKLLTVTFPDASTAVQVTVVVPTGKNVPEG